MASVVAIMMVSPPDPRIKSQLASRIGADEGRRDLALAMLDDIIEHCDRLPGVLTRIAVTQPAEGLRMHRPSLPGTLCLAQRGASVADRLRHIFTDLAAAGFTSTLLVCASVPDLPLTHFEQALGWVDDDRGTLVIGPSGAGGCYAIGLAVQPGAVPDLFTAVRWGSPHELDDVARAGAELGLSVKYLPAWRAVEGPDDLSFVAARLRRAPHTAPKTAAVLKRLLNSEF